MEAYQTPSGKWAQRASRYEREKYREQQRAGGLVRYCWTDEHGNRCSLWTDRHMAQAYLNAECDRNACIIE